MAKFLPKKNRKSPFMDERLNGFLLNLGYELLSPNAIYSIYHRKQKIFIQTLSKTCCLWLSPTIEGISDNWA